MLVMTNRVDPTVRLDLQPLQDRLPVGGNRAGPGMLA
jgi:hypothetical protein